MNLLLSILTHHGDPADPDLLEQIKHQLDSIFGVGPGLLVVIFGLLIALIPVSIMVFYVLQRRRMGVPIKEDDWQPEAKP